MSVSSPPRPHFASYSLDAAVSPALQVERWNGRHDGPLTERALEEKIRALGYHLLPILDPHGALVSARVHPFDRAVAVLGGVLKVTLEGESAILMAGDIAFVPGGCTRRVEPMGTAPLLCVEAVCRLPRS